MSATVSNGKALGFLSAVLVVFLAVPGVATASDTGTAAFKPDGRIRLQKTASEYFGTTQYDDPWTGDDVYNTTGQGQAFKQRYYTEAPGWDRWVLGLSLQNDGASSDSMRVQATGTSVRGWSVKYYVGATNVTSAVVNGTFATPSLAPGEEYLVKVKVTRHELFDTDPLRRLVSVTSTSSPTEVDAVKLVFRPGTCGC